MPLPAAIVESSTIRWSDHRSCVPGPFENGTALYAILVDTSANKLRS